jgi:mono/diheme cytochrome c family protein
MPSSQDRRETHSDAGHNWALVLAAGEGSRLQSLTMTASGVAVPKQFCSLGGDQSLLQELVHLRCRRAGFATSVRGALSGSHRGNAGRRHRERRLLDMRYIFAGILLTLCATCAWSAEYVQMTGEQLYHRFCASCHGAQGRGDGLVAASFKVEVPDLTLLARRAGGVFPRERIARIIDGRHVIGAHGSRSMPVWGEDFGRAQLGSPDAERATRLLIDRIAEYLASLQKPVAP